MSMKKRKISLVEMKTKQRKHLQKIMNLTKKNIDDFKSLSYKETHDRHMKEIKQKVSPNGGRKAWGLSNNEEDN